MEMLQEGRSALCSGKDHVVLFPFMSKGHMMPLLHFSAAISARGIGVTFITTPGNSSFVSEALLPEPNVHILQIPFPSVPSIPPGCECTDVLPSMALFPAFLQATKLLQQPFREALQCMAASGSLPLCVVSDFFLDWTLDDCRRFGVPRLVSHGMGVFAMTLCKEIVVRHPHITAAAAGEDTFKVKGMPDGFRLTVADVPEPIRNPADAAAQSTEVGSADAHSWGVLVNSFQEMEKDYVKLFESFLLCPGAQAWLVGPLFLYPRLVSTPELCDGKRANTPCLRWLDAKPSGSVIYVAFGTQARMSTEQLDEVAYGLDMSGYNFLLVVKSGTWSPPDGTLRRGLLVSGWAPQLEVLEHPAIGGFLSHCGWNSVLESLCAGVPILAWPMSAEQPLNAKYVVDVLGVGIRLGNVVPAAATTADGERGLVGRTEICEGVKELMSGGEKGTKMRERAAELGKAARAAVACGGASQQNLSTLLEELRTHKKGRKMGTVDGSDATVNGGV